MILFQTIELKTSEERAVWFDELDLDVALSRSRRCTA